MIVKYVLFSEMQTKRNLHRCKKKDYLSYFKAVIQDARQPLLVIWNLEKE